MRSSICDGNVDKGSQSLRQALQEHGAQLVDKDWAMGVDVYKLKIKGQEVNAFIDTWGVDIDGPTDITEAVQATYAKMRQA